MANARKRNSESPNDQADIRVYRPNTSSVVVIPARMESTRLPRKLLLRETGKTVIQHTYEAAVQSRLTERVLIATDHDEIRQEALGFGADARLTDPNARSGTDRVAEVAKSLDGVDIVVKRAGR